MSELLDEHTECHHCGETGASKRVLLESGALWFHFVCFDRWQRYGCSTSPRKPPPTTQESQSG
jgi:hypothetical protein